MDPVLIPQDPHVYLSVGPLLQTSAYLLCKAMLINNIIIYMYTAQTPSADLLHGSVIANLLGRLCTGLVQQLGMPWNEGDYKQW